MSQQNYEEVEQVSAGVFWQMISYNSLGVQWLSLFLMSDHYIVYLLRIVYIHVSCIYRRRIDDCLIFVCQLRFNIARQRYCYWAVKSDVCE